MKSIDSRGTEVRSAACLKWRLNWQLLARALFVCGVLVQVGPAYALGLGQATVESYFQQPLNARIDLISRSEAELATVTAAMASPADFQVMGLTRADISVPLEFTVNRDLADPHIRVTSSLPMNEPVVQLVIEVVWSSGRMLRQYTMFLDPPTFAAPAPLPAPSNRAAAEPSAADIASMPALEPDASTAVEPPVSEAIEAGPPFEPATRIDDAIATSPADDRPAVADTETAPPELEAPVTEVTPSEATEMTVESDSGESDVVAPVMEQPDLPEAVAANSDTIDPVVPEAEAIDPIAPESEVVEPSTGESLVMEPAEADTSPSAAVEPEPEPLPEPVAPEPKPAPVVAEEAPGEPPAYRAVLPNPGVGPTATVAVERGDTLWSLSREFGRAQGMDVNQVMLAVQQKNPGAFINGNINRLKAGAILRMPTQDEARRLSARDAMLEVMRQETLYRNRATAPVTPDQVPVVTNLVDAPIPEESDIVQNESEALPEPEEVAVAAAEESRLELVPPSEDEDVPVDAMGQAGSGETGVSQGESVVEELARTQEELTNAQQENAYLADRIAELEAELARREAPQESGVSDTNLAEMEERLRNQRAEGETEPEPDVISEATSKSWLDRFGGWLLGLAVVLIGGTVVYLRGRRNGDSDDVLVTESPGDQESQRTPAETEKPAVASVAKTANAKVADEEAEVADIDDPEARLDLARAYLAMGKVEQARELLTPVIEEGTPEQAREARDMLSDS